MPAEETLIASSLEEALAATREAADYEAALPVDFGPPLAGKPARELEGEILMELGRADEAVGAFTLALGRTPNRILSLAGFARAAEQAGLLEAAEAARGTLRELLDGADADVMETLGERQR